MALDVRGREGDPIDHGVEARVAERLSDGGRVVEVGGQAVYSGGQVRRAKPAGDECEVDAALGGQVRCSGTDDSGAAQEKNSHVKVVADRAAPTARSLLPRSEEHTSELQSPMYLVCRL